MNIIVEGKNAKQKLRISIQIGEIFATLWRIYAI